MADCNKYCNSRVPPACSPGTEKPLGLTLSARGLFLAFWNLLSKLSVLMDQITIQVDIPQNILRRFNDVVKRGIQSSIEETEQQLQAHGEDCVKRYMENTVRPRLLNALANRPLCLNTAKDYDE